MPLHPRTRLRRASDGGFTLIELLVVITILGILAGIVVFAVQGIGDKGKANAAAEDASILRTAEEANCAQHSQYATIDELVANKLIASAKTINTVSLGDDLVCGTTPGRSSFSIFDPTAASAFATNALAVGSSPTDVAVDAKTNKIYVANSGDNTVSVINGAKDTIEGSPIAVGDTPTYIAVNPANDKVYVSNRGDDTGEYTVSVIDGAHGTVLDTVPFDIDGVPPGAITVNPANDEVYVAPNSQASGVMVIDGGASNTGTDVTLPGGGIFATDAGVVVNAMTNTAYLLGGDDASSLVSIDGTTHDVASHPLPFPLDSFSFLAVDATTNRIFVTSNFITDPAHPTTERRGATATVDGSDYSVRTVQEATNPPIETLITVNPNTHQLYSLGQGGSGNVIMHFDPVAQKYLEQSGANLAALSTVVPAQTHQLVVNP
ncbi:MAG TPA: prepilin-type N-terminal cleavage/methylation domain-containing protein, partial [Solirubrobacteraceae bacterium]|nr:prepilin-type N-terminal cleavage/methylation domain-containing protein [Solirubrobacteraceae bacterium]